MKVHGTKCVVAFLRVQKSSLIISGLFRFLLQVIVPACMATGVTRSHKPASHSASPSTSLPATPGTAGPRASPPPTLEATSSPRKSNPSRFLGVYLQATPLSFTSQLSVHLLESSTPSFLTASVGSQNLAASFLDDCNQQPARSVLLTPYNASSTQGRQRVATYHTCHPAYSALGLWLTVLVPRTASRVEFVLQSYTFVTYEAVRAVTAID